MPTQPTLESRIVLALGGDLNALEAILKEIQDPIYRLALRMLGNPADAQDASQEVLLKVTTSLASFRGDSQFSTWVHRIAVNHLLSELRQKAPKTSSFDEIARDLEQGMAYGATQAEASSEDSAVAFEVFVSCTQRLLSALDVDDRVAYVLGDLCDIPGAQAAEVLNITPAAFRQRLSRARGLLTSFVDARCGVANPANACRCAKQVPAALAVGYIDPSKRVYALQSVPDPSSKLALQRVANTVSELGELISVARLWRSQGEFAAPNGLVDRLRGVLASKKYRTLQ